jgi:hypothetical protein
VPFFADRVQEGDKQTGLGRTRWCPVLLIADEKADMATSTRMSLSRLHALSRQTGLGGGVAESRVFVICKP